MRLILRLGIIILLAGIVFSVLSGKGCLLSKDKNDTGSSVDIRWTDVVGGCVGLHTMALKSDGSLWAWGSNYSGELGIDTGGFPQKTPARVGTDTNWAQVSADSIYTIALKTAPSGTGATLWAWGYNEYGQLGLGDITERYFPTQVSTDTDWAKIATGGEHTLALKTDNTLWAWGYNEYGQLGLGDITNRLSPIQVVTDTDWTQVSAGSFHTIAIKTNGTLWVWGRNFYGQLGFGDTTNRLFPTQVVTDTDWAQVSGGGLHTIALKTNGTLWAWGYNDYGQLGLGGDTISRTIPTQVGTDTNWAQVSAGGSHTIALKSNGTLWAWGENLDGQLGLGDTINRTTPTQVGLDTNWLKVAARDFYSLALKTNGTLWVWGDNQYGQLGLGDTIQRNIPTKVEQ